MQVTLRASFDPDKNMMQVKGDKSGRIWFEFDAQQYPQVIKLGLIPAGKLLKLTIEDEK